MNLATPIRTIQELHSIMACAWTTIRDVWTSKSTEKQFHLAGRHESRFLEGGIAHTEGTVGRLRRNKIARASSNGDSLRPEKKRRANSKPLSRPSSLPTKTYKVVFWLSRIARESKHLFLNQPLPQAPKKAVQSDQQDNMSYNECERRQSDPRRVAQLDAILQKERGYLVFPDFFRAVVAQDHIELAKREYLFLVLGVFEKLLLAMTSASGTGSIIKPSVGSIFRRILRLWIVVFDLFLLTMQWTSHSSMKIHWLSLPLLVSSLTVYGSTNCKGWGDNTSSWWSDAFRLTTCLLQISGYVLLIFVLYLALARNQTHNFMRAFYVFSHYHWASGSGWMHKRLSWSCEISSRLKPSTKQRIAVRSQRFAASM